MTRSSLWHLQELLQDEPLAAVSPTLANFDQDT